MRRSKLLILSFLLVVVALVAAAPSWYFYSRYKAEHAKLANPTEAAKEEAKANLEKVRALILLPKDEEPTVATVTDPTKLQGQAFFANAEKGDILIIYTGAKRAIIYRPGANLIVNVASINIDNSASVSAQSATGETSFDLRNGTTVADFTKKYETVLKTKLLNAVVVNRVNAKKQDYLSSVLIDNTPGGNREAASVSKALGVPLIKLPAGEATSGAQFTLILGADQK